MKKKFIKNLNSTFNLPDFDNGFVQAGDIPCKGNGMILGLTNGTDNFGHKASGYDYTNLYGEDVGSTANTGQVNTGGVGVTTDTTKSGIIADTSSLTLVCNMIIKI